MAIAIFANLQHNTLLQKSKNSLGQKTTEAEKVISQCDSCPYRRTSGETYLKGGDYYDEGLRNGLYWVNLQG